MSSQYRKIQASQSGPYSAQRNLLDFYIPPDVYDFNKSYVELSCFTTVPDPDATAGTGTGLYQVRTSLSNAHTGANDNEYTEPLSLIKNVSFRTDAKGVLENRRRNDRLMTNLNYFTKSSEMIYSESQYNGLFNISRSDDVSFSGNIEVFKRDGKSGRNVSRRLRVPLKDLMTLGNVSNMDLNRLGQGQLHCELQVGNVVVNGENEPDAPKNTQGAGPRDLANSRNFFLDIPENTANITQIVSRGIYPDLDLVPHYIDEKVTITTNGTGGAANINEVRRITNIEYDTAGTYGNNVTDRVVVTFTPALSSGTGAGQTMLTVNALPLTQGGTGTITFDEANLVLNVPDKPAPMAPVLSYTTFTLEEDNGGTRNNFIKTYELEPECRNIFICFGPDIISVLGGITTYKITIDNEDVTERLIKHGSAEHKELIRKFFDNSGRPMRRVKEQSFNNDSQLDVQNYEAGALEIIACPVPITESEKLLHLEINATGTGVNNFSIFKEVERAI